MSIRRLTKAYDSLLLHTHETATEPPRRRAFLILSLGLGWMDATRRRASYHHHCHSIESIVFLFLLSSVWFNKSAREERTYVMCNVCASAVCEVKAKRLLNLVPGCVKVRKGTQKGIGSQQTQYTLNEYRNKTKNVVPRNTSDPTQTQFACC